MCTSKTSESKIIERVIQKLNYGIESDTVVVCNYDMIGLAEEPIRFQYPIFEADNFDTGTPSFFYIKNGNILELFELGLKVSTKKELNNTQQNNQRFENVDIFSYILIPNFEPIKISFDSQPEYRLF